MLKWIKGLPPVGTDIAWLRVIDAGGPVNGDDGADTVLGIYCHTQSVDQYEWHEAANWKGKSSKDPISEKGQVITHYQPYGVPEPAIAVARTRIDATVKPRTAFQSISFWIYFFSVYTLIALVVDTALGWPSNRWKSMGANAVVSFVLMALWGWSKKAMPWDPSPSKNAD